MRYIVMRGSDREMSRSLPVVTEHMCLCNVARLTLSLRLFMLLFQSLALIRQQNHG